MEVLGKCFLYSSQAMTKHQHLHNNCHGNDCYHHDCHDNDHRNGGYDYKVSLRVSICVYVCQVFIYESLVRPTNTGVVFVLVGGPFLESFECCPFVDFGH